jgi:hypothetical protein
VTRAAAKLPNRWFRLLCVLAVSSGCAGSPEVDSSAEPVSRCSVPAGTSNAPHSIAEVTQLLNTLPRPVTLECFLESLARPLALNATFSVFSAQPAVGKRSPRMFVFLDPLIVSVAPEGMGRHLLEFGELRTETRSLKAELEFPIEAELAEGAAFERLHFDDMSTSCSFCHATEERADDITFARAYTSIALRPSPSEHIDLTSVYAEFLACDAELEPERCALLRGLFNNGPVIERAFSAAFRTFTQ